MADNAGFVASVTSLGADVVALQEVDSRTVRSWFLDQPSIAARASGLRPLFASARSIGPGGRYGNALLVRGEVRAVRTLELPWTGERRVALIAEVELPGGRATVVSTHLQNRRGSAPSQAPQQLEHLVGALRSWPAPVVLMGDLNLRDDRVLPILDGAGFDTARGGPTFPSDAPRIEIDWIAVQGFRVDRTEVPDLRSSDHRPLVADLSPIQG